MEERLAPICHHKYIAVSLRDFSGCNSCTKELITITKNEPGAHDLDGDVIETMVSCSFRTLTCKGTNANIEVIISNFILQMHEACDCYVKIKKRKDYKIVSIGSPLPFFLEIFLKDSDNIKRACFSLHTRVR